MKERLFRLFNLKVSESKYVFDLISIQLFIGIANSLINIIAFTLFIHHFAVSVISYAYIAIAGVLLLLNIGYEKLEKKLTPLHLLRLIILSSAIIVILFRTGFLLLHEEAMIFLLLIWSTLFYMITGYAYWGLVSLLFNIRESKRVFAIVGSGDIPAKLIGYIAAPLLIPIIGLENLLLVAVAALFVGFFLLNRLIHKKRWEKIEHRAHAPKHHPVTHGDDSLLSFFFKHKLILTISLLSLLSYNVFNLVDYTFVTQIKAKIHNLSSLATYIAIFFGAGRLIALVLKLVFTSRMIERLGLIFCLLITPITLAAFSLAFAAFDNGDYTLYIFGAMAMLTEVLRSAMQEPVFFILFQPLNEHQRLRGHIIAKGYMMAPSLFIVGATLIVLRQFHVELTISLTIKLLLANLCVWAGVVFYIKRAYANALNSSISRGVFNGEIVKIRDQTTMNILLDKLEKGNQPEKIYALKLLEDSDYPELNPLLEQQLFTDNAAAKIYALERLEHRNAININILNNVVASENDELVREKLITLLSKHDRDFLDNISADMPALQRGIRKQVIIILLAQQEFHYVHKGANEIHALIRSADAKERELALEIISDLKSLQFTDAIQSLIDDPDPSVKRNALTAACKLKNKKMLPFVFERLAHPLDKFPAIQGLFQYGDKLFADIEIFDEAELELRKPDLIKIAAKTKGPLSTRFLLNSLQQIPFQDDKIIHVLWSKSFQAETVEDIHRFQTLLNETLRAGISKIPYHNSVPSFQDHELLKRSIGSELWGNVTTALKLCAMLYSVKEINRVIELVETRERHKLYNGMEMLEMILPKKISRQINEMFDHLLDPLSSKRKMAVKNTSGFFAQIFEAGSASFNQWTKAMCVYCSLKNNEHEFINELKKLPPENESIVLSETKAYVLQNLQPSSYAHY